MEEWLLDWKESQSKLEEVGGGGFWMVGVIFLLRLVQSIWSTFCNKLSSIHYGSVCVRADWLNVVTVIGATFLWCYFGAF